MNYKPLVRQPSLHRWPVVINTSMTCRYCKQEILGAGETDSTGVRGAISRHKEVCPGKLEGDR